MKLQIILFFLIIVHPSCNVFGATFVVSSNKGYADQNPGNGTCTTGYSVPDNCTLRAAIEEANSNINDHDIITFDRPLQFSRYTSDLPRTGNLTIDGSSQWNTADDIPGISIAAAALFTALEIGYKTVVKGIFFGGSGNGIVVNNSESDILIGGSEPHERNIFFSGDTGIYLKQGTRNITIQYNYFGTKNGETFGADDLFIGDTAIYGWGTSDLVIEHNIIGEQQDDGIYLTQSYFITIADNYIGVSGDGSNKKIPNGDCGIYVTNSQFANINITGNKIAGNLSAQIHIEASTGINIVGNNIGSFDAPINPSLSQANGIEFSGTYLRHTTIAENAIEFNNGNGIFITSGSPSIEHNGIANNGKNGIVLQNVVDGQLAQITGNGISLNSDNGIVLDNVANMQISSNKIGLGDLGFSDDGNGSSGILLQNGSTGNIIGGVHPDDGNYIGYNYGSGIYLTGNGTSHNQVGYNTIGSSPEKLINWGYVKAGNHQHGIAVYDHADNNDIGVVADALTPNLILDSHWRGIAVINSDGNRIFGNQVGTDNATRNWGNGYSGIQVAGSSNSVKYNTVAFNGYKPTLPQAGIVVEGSSSIGNQMSKNSIFHNGATGIALVNGGNQNLQPPSLTRDGKTLAGTTCPSCTVEFFSGPDKDEGKVFEGSTQAESSGKFTWQIQGHVQGKHITTTTTTSLALSTSEFSSSVQGYTFPWPMFLPAMTGDHM